MNSNKKIIGPFKQILTMNGLPLKGALKDEQLKVIKDGAILITDGLIEAVGNFKTLQNDHPTVYVEELTEDLVALPGLIDAHTHICFGGSRAIDYAARNNGKTYLEIAAEGGGIWSTVNHTREATDGTLAVGMQDRIKKQIQNGITSVEVKSGYGLSLEAELKMLRVINDVKKQADIDLIPTCLAAHIIPKEFNDEQRYLHYILEHLVPAIDAENLCKRFDIFIEQSAFSAEGSKIYLQNLINKGFDITVHADQFTSGGSKVAVEVGALSADHLEASTDEDIQNLAASNTVAVALPGASIGLGCKFTPARKLLDAGACLAIASDWNPGSAPQGNLLAQAAILGTFEKLSTAEVLAGISVRAAKALNLTDRGVLAENKIADLCAFPTSDFRDILYHQGELKPKFVWKKGKQIL